jgi:cobalt-zinc-cadmium efflux system membrane fusion protein
MKVRSVVGSLLVLLVGAGLAWFVFRSDRPFSTAKTASPGAAEAPTGPHGGRLLSDGSFQLEITIYERGVPPHFRIYAFEGRRPLDPQQVRLGIELHRLGGRVDAISFRPEADYLLGDRTVEEPHSFDIKVVAERNGQTHRWEYAQIEGRIEMPPETVASSGIVVASAGPKRMQRVLELHGEVTLSADRVARVAPRLGGILLEVRPSLGAKVNRGELLAAVENREVADAKREFVEARHRLAFARTAAEREEVLWKKKISAEEELLTKRHAFEEARIVERSARQKLRILGVPEAEVERLATDDTAGGGRYEIRAPLDGTIIERRATLGEVVKSDDAIFVIADLRTVWVNVAIPTQDLRSVRVGQSATVRAHAIGLEAAGTLAYLDPVVGEDARVAKGRVVVDNRDGQWRPGLFTTVRVVLEEATVPIAVKTDALQKWRDSEVVFAQFGKFFEVRPVKLGRNNGEWAEVLDGLTAGQKYAIENSFVLRAELEKSQAKHDH